MLKSSAPSHIPDDMGNVRCRVDYVHDSAEMSFLECDIAIIQHGTCRKASVVCRDQGHNRLQNWALVDTTESRLAVDSYMYLMRAATGDGTRLGVLKNAFDVLFHEWAGKPAVVISNGARGQQGGRAVGAVVAEAKDAGRGLWRRVHD